MGKSVNWYRELPDLGTIKTECCTPSGVFFEGCHVVCVSVYCRW